MVGDSFTDMEAGYRAGCGCCIFVTTGGNSREEFILWLNKYFQLELTYGNNDKCSYMSLYRIIIPTPLVSRHCLGEKSEQLISF